MDMRAQAHKNYFERGLKALKVLKTFLCGRGCKRCDFRGTCGGFEEGCARQLFVLVVVYFYCGVVL